jgi:sodium-dependent dicarboxylate transporter 2/3/5
MVLRVTPGLPSSIGPTVATLGVVLVCVALGWLVHLAGWPRQQVIVTAIVSGTVLLWVLEILPLFSTAFMSMAAQILFLGNPGGWSWVGFENGDGPSSGDFLGAAADPVLLLFFSGLILARAIAKTGLHHHIAARVLRPMAATPSRLLLGVIATTSLLSLVMSNTATTALMLTLIAPILDQLPSTQSFRRALVLAVPTSANIAGMSTPVSSPPNAIAMSYLARGNQTFSFQDWILLAGPIVIILLATTWWWLLRCYPPTRAEWRLTFPEAPLSASGAWVVTVAVATFAAWLSEPWHGVPASVAALLPVALFFATTVIDRDDVNSLDWDVLILIAGGLTLGYSLQATGMDQKLAGVVPTGGSSLASLAALGFATLTLGTFFSNTAIASMLMPVAVVVAAGTTQLDLTSAALMVALSASMSIALPVSTPPNAMAYATGELTSRDFIRSGGYIGAFGTIIILVLLAVLRG